MKRKPKYRLRKQPKDRLGGKEVDLRLDWRAEQLRKDLGRTEKRHTG